jgi:predicted PurR-regulated permease PerM
MRPDIATGVSDSRFPARVAATVLVAIIFAALYLGREVFVPIALAVLLSFVLAPPVQLLENWRFPRTLAVMIVALFAFLLIFALGRVITTQLSDLAADLPRYQQTMREKIQSVRFASATSRPLERAADMLQNLRKEFEKPKSAEVAVAGAEAGGDTPSADTAKPIPVEIHQPPNTALESVAGVIAPLIHPLATSGMIVIFVLFILFQREDLRNRVIKLAGSHDLQKTTAALDDAAGRLSRLFLTQLALNAGFGVVIGIGLWLIGVPSPALWGIMAAVLRFVPYVGAFIAAIFPLTLAIAVDPGWSMLLWTAALFVVVEPFVGHVLEPLFYGHSTGLSPFAVVVSATLWTALWGPVGLILATPLTICLVVLGRHVEELRFLDIMLGDQPALSPHELFYQRMLVGDPSEAVDKAEEFLKKKPLLAYYDEVALKGLQLAQADMSRGMLDAARVERIRESVDELIDDLEDEPLSNAEAAKTRNHDEDDDNANDNDIAPDLPVLTTDQLPESWREATPILCVAARNELDAAAAAMLTQLLFKHGMNARVAAAAEHGTSGIFRLETSGVAVVCISSLDPGALAPVRYAVRRLRRKLPNATFIAGCWNDQREPAEMKSMLQADEVVTSLRQAVACCLAAAGAELPASTAVAETPARPIAV